MTISEQTIPAVKPGFTLEEKKEMAAFCFIGVFDDQTQFLDVRYAGQNEGRTCIIMGNLGITARIVGSQRGVFYNERLGIDEKKEESFDITPSIKRTEMQSVTIRRTEPDWTKADLTDEEIEAKPKYQYDVIVSYSGGHITIHGLSQENAVTFRSIIWMWMNYLL